MLLRYAPGGFCRLGVVGLGVIEIAEPDDIQPVLSLIAVVVMRFGSRGSANGTGLALDLSTGEGSLDGHPRAVLALDDLFLSDQTPLLAGAWRGAPGPRPVASFLAVRGPVPSLAVRLSVGVQFSEALVGVSAGGGMSRLMSGKNLFPPCEGQLGRCLPLRMGSAFMLGASVPRVEVTAADSARHAICSTWLPLASFVT